MGIEIEYPLRYSDTLVLGDSLFRDTGLLLSTLETSVARCLLFNRTVRYFGFLSGIKMILIPENACVNNSIFCATDIDTVRSGIFERATWQPYTRDWHCQS